MKLVRKALALSTLAVTFSAGLAFAQDRDDHGHDQDHGHYVRHDEWKHGSKISHDDWNRGEQVDYKQHHLHAPPRGYEWRQVDGNYVMAAAATGLISSVVIASTVH
jgi:Ni/Co efflux regulator RcnB